MKFNLKKMLFSGRMLRLFKNISKFFSWFFKGVRPMFWWLASFFSALWYRFPARKLLVVGVVGSRGKTTTSEIIGSILEEAGYKTSIATTSRFKVGGESKKNNLDGTMPGRFFTQKFLRRAVRAKCQYAILELGSFGLIKNKHKFLKINFLVFTNLASEFGEAYKNFEDYRNSKLKVFKALEKSREKTRAIIVNEDDSNASYFLNLEIENKIKYSLQQAKHPKLRTDGLEFVYKETKINSKLSGQFNLYNILSASAFAVQQNIGISTIQKAIEKFSGVGGIMEEINLVKDGLAQNKFKVVVDYSSNPDALEKVYEFFQSSRKICVLGGSGVKGDKKLRKKRGRVAARNCDQVILTNENPYDEDPRKILEDVAKGIFTGRYEIVPDRREAIANALKKAGIGDTVVITGKGSEQWIYGAKGTKIKWDDREVAREELQNLTT
jgi:UDP-N-acetylmuramoyl-L-alanyl-D-glutamate--2,6-diaminopimelate ligase